MLEGVDIVECKTYRTHASDSDVSPIFLYIFFVVFRGAEGARSTRSFNLQGQLIDGLTPKHHVCDFQIHHHVRVDHRGTGEGSTSAVQSNNR